MAGTYPTTDQIIFKLVNEYVKTSFAAYRITPSERSDERKQWSDDMKAILAATIIGLGLAAGAMSAQAAPLDHHYSGFPMWAQQAFSGSTNR